VQVRFSRKRRRAIAAWTGGQLPDAVADQAVYVGSAEHKAHWSPATGQPALRADATPCDPSLTASVDANTAALREGIRRRCTSEVFEQGFPKYVWSWIGSDLYEARHINGPAGQYKGYRLDPVEWPEDPEGRLRWKES